VTAATSSPSTRDRVIDRRHACDASKSTRPTDCRSTGRAAAHDGWEPPSGTDESGKLVLPIPGKQLVGALTGKCDRHMARRELGERQEAERRQVGKRLIEMPDQLLEIDGILGDREFELVMLRRQVVRDEGGIRQLVALR